MAALLFIGPTAASERGEAKPVDPSVTPETANLLRSLHRIGWDPDKIVFGQEFPLSYRRAGGFNQDLEQSDCHDVVGDHPGIHGSDFHYILDKPKERQTHIDAVLKAHAAGAIITFDYHWLGRYGGTHNYHPKDGKILHNVVAGDDSNGDVTWFYQQLDAVLKIVNEDLRVPMVFRPFHENNGKWFWWGSRLKGGPETFKQAYRILVEYLSKRTEYMLFCWSPDKGLVDTYYPGDAFVDVIGMDVYGAGVVRWLSIEDMICYIGEAVDFAAARGKVAAITEIGYSEDGNDPLYPTGKADWWMANVLNPILASEKARRTAWMLTWINADWAPYPYIPDSQTNEAAKADFRSFHAHPVTLFQKEVEALKVYE